MSNQDRRRQARVQGAGWACNKKTKPVLRKTEIDQEHIKSVQQQQVAVTDGYPAWTTKNVDCPKQKGFIYQRPNEEELRRKPPDRVIDEGGVYDLSRTDTGLSRVRYYPLFLNRQQADHAFSSLLTELHWTQKTNRRHGITYLEPRLTAWFGDVPYLYSGVVQEANPNWTPTLVFIKERVEELTGIRFNSMLANLYRDGKDSIDWHADDEVSLGNDPLIASVSLGETRSFELRQNPGPEERTADGQRDHTYMQHVRIPLTHGSLLLMEGSTQHDWQHRVPKEYHDRDARINLTFRIINTSS